MNRREIVFLVTGGIVFLVVLLGFYLPRTAALKELNAAIRSRTEEIDRLDRSIPDRSIEDGYMTELVSEAASLRNSMAREYDISLATGELVQLCRDAGGITIDSITEVGKVDTAEGREYWLIKLFLRSSFYDFARLLSRFNDSGQPLAVEGFTITNNDNQSPLSIVELTVAVCSFKSDTGIDEMME